MVTGPETAGLANSVHRHADVGLADVGLLVASVGRSTRLLGPSSRRGKRPYRGAEVHPSTGLTGARLPRHGLVADELDHRRPQRGSSTSLGRTPRSPRRRAASSTVTARPRSRSPPVRESHMRAGSQERPPPAWPDRGRQVHVESGLDSGRIRPRLPRAWTRHESPAVRASASPSAQRGPRIRRREAPDVDSAHGRAAGHPVAGETGSRRRTGRRRVATRPNSSQGMTRRSLVR